MEIPFHYAVCFFVNIGKEVVGGKVGGVTIRAVLLQSSGWMMDDKMG